MGRTKFCSVCGTKIIEPFYLDEDTILCEACFYEAELFNDMIENFDTIEVDNFRTVWPEDELEEELWKEEEEEF